MSSQTPTPFRAAFEARDHDALVRAVAPDVVLYSPVIEVPFQGRDEVGDLLGVVLETLEALEYVAEVPGDDVHVLNFKATIGGTPVEGVDLLRFNDAGEVREITVLMRPFPGIAAFLKASGAKLARLRGGRAKGLATAAGGAPLTALMRASAASTPRLLSLSAARSKRGS